MYVSYTLLDGGGFPLVTYRNPTEALRMLVMTRTANLPITLQQQVHRTIEDYSPEELIERWKTWQGYIAKSRAGYDWEEALEEALAEGYSVAAEEVSKRYTELTGRSILDDSEE